MPAVSACPNCRGTNLYTHRVASAGGNGPVLLPGLGKFLYFPKFDAVVCADCGLTRLFAEPSAREKLAGNPQWRRLDVPPPCPSCGYDLTGNASGVCPECGTERVRPGAPGGTP